MKFFSFAKDVIPEELGLNETINIGGRIARRTSDGIRFVKDSSQPFPKVKDGRQTKRGIKGERESFVSFSEE